MKWRLSNNSIDNNSDNNWRLSNNCTYSMLMTFLYPDLGSVSDLLKKISLRAWLIRSTMGSEPSSIWKFWGCPCLTQGCCWNSKQYSKFSGKQLCIDKVYSSVVLITCIINVTLWFVFTLVVFDMHKRCRSLREMVTTTGYDPRTVFELLLNTAQFELNLKEVQYRTITCYKFSLLCCTCSTFMSIWSYWQDSYWGPALTHTTLNEAS